MMTDAMTARLKPVKPENRATFRFLILGLRKHVALWRDCLRVMRGRR